jgi:hypothetical protein
MASGFQHIIAFHEDSSGVPSLDSFVRKEYTHDVGAVASQSVMKNDFAGTPNDAFIAQFSYPAGTEPATTTTVAQILTRAKDAVNTFYGNGEAGVAT